MRGHPFLGMCTPLAPTRATVNQWRTLPLKGSVAPLSTFTPAKWKTNSGSLRVMTTIVWPLPSLASRQLLTITWISGSYWTSSKMCNPHFWTLSQRLLLSFRRPFATRVSSTAVDSSPSLLYTLLSSSSTLSTLYMIYKREWCCILTAMSG